MALNKKGAQYLNQLSKRTYLESLNQDKVAAMIKDGAEIENPTKWVVAKEFVCATRSGPFRFPAGKVIEDPAVKYQLESQGAELRPIA